MKKRDSTNSPTHLNSASAKNADASLPMCSSRSLALRPAASVLAKLGKDIAKEVLQNAYVPALSNLAARDVLIFDDVWSMRDFFRDILVDFAGIKGNCYEAESTQEAIALLENRKLNFSLMIQDYNHPNGILPKHLAELDKEDSQDWLIRHALELRPDLKIIMLSGNITRDAMARFKVAGAFHCGTKPFDFTEIESLIRAILLGNQAARSSS